MRATEAYTTLLRGQRRRLLPLYSLMIATAPLPTSAWDDIGWTGGETVADGRHLVIYAQRTADGRIAFGGRGAPYHFGSRVSSHFDREDAVFRALEETLHDLLPPTRGRGHAPRGGPIGVARDWSPSVTIDREAGIAWAGGIRRRRRIHEQRRGSHPCRPHPRARDGADAAAVGAAPLTAMGARTAALAGGQRRRACHAQRRRRGAAHGPSLTESADGDAIAGPLTLRPCGGRRPSAVSSWRLESCSLRSTDETCVSTVLTDRWRRGWRSPCR